MLRGNFPHPWVDVTENYILCTSVAGYPLYVRKCTLIHGRAVDVQTWHWMFGCFLDVLRTSVVAWDLLKLHSDAQQNIFFPMQLYGVVNARTIRGDLETVTRIAPV